jgi:hypothetical protein
LTTISLSTIVKGQVVTRQLPTLKLSVHRYVVVMSMSRRSHPKSEIEAALAYAQAEWLARRTWWIARLGQNLLPLQR